jgi:hypothetical protein
MRKRSINIPTPERSDFVAAGVATRKGFRSARGWLAKVIAPKDEAKPKKKKKKEKAGE